MAANLNPAWCVRYVRRGFPSPVLCCCHCTGWVPLRQEQEVPDVLLHAPFRKGMAGHSGVVWTRPCQSQWPIVIHSATNRHTCCQCSDVAVPIADLVTHKMSCDGPGKAIEKLAGEPA